MAKNMLARIVSWLEGRRIGETRVCRGPVFRRGDAFGCTLPDGLWIDSKNQSTYFAAEEQWDGFGWAPFTVYEITRDDWKLMLLGVLR